MRLKHEQRRLYELLPAEARCFVRICDDDNALWVSDLPRKYAQCDKLAEMLRTEGFEVLPDGPGSLWYLDWTMERWQEMLSLLPRESLQLPQDERYHEAYALCRLWAAHPAPLEPEHLPALRRVVKMTAAKPEKVLKSVRILMEEAAVQLRERKTAAHAAGWVLEVWLTDNTPAKEMQS